MPLLKAEAAKLSNNDLVAGIVQEIIDVDATYALLPFLPTVGKAHVFNRENALPTTAFYAENATITDSAATFTEVTVTLKKMMSQVEIDKFLATVMGDTNDQVAVQIAAASKSVEQKFRTALAQGDTVADPNSFDGLSKLVTAGQTIAAATNGAAVTFDMLDQLKDMVKLGPDALIMRRGTWRAIKSLMRSTGGIVPEMIQLENFGKPVPSFDGIPVLMNDFIPANEVQGTSGATTTSIYAARMNVVDGLHGLYPANTPLGIQLEDIGTPENRDGSIYRLKWYTGVALKSTNSLARLKGVTNV